MFSLKDFKRFQAPLSPEQIRTLIEQSGMSKSALAKACGISHPALAVYEKDGTKNANGTTQIVLSMAFEAVCGSGIVAGKSSRAELQDRLERLLKDPENETRSDRAIARAAGCDNKTVAAARTRLKALKSSEEILQPKNEEIAQNKIEETPQQETKTAAPLPTQERAIARLLGWAQDELALRYEQLSALESEDYERAQQDWQGLPAVAEAYTLLDYIRQLPNIPLLHRGVLEQILTAPLAFEAMPYAPVGWPKDLSRVSGERLAKARKTMRALEKARAALTAIKEQPAPPAPSKPARNPSSYKLPKDLLNMEADRLDQEFNEGLLANSLRYGMLSHVVEQLGQVPSKHRRAVEHIIERIVAVTAPDEQPMWPLKVKVARAEFLHRVATRLEQTPEHPGLAWLLESVEEVTSWGWLNIAGLDTRDLPGLASLWSQQAYEWSALTQVVGEPSYAIAPYGPRRWRISTPYSEEFKAWAKRHHGAWQPQHSAWRVEGIERDEVLAALERIFGAEPGAAWSTVRWDKKEHNFVGTVELHGERWGIVSHQSARLVRADASSFGAPNGMERGYQHYLLWRDATLQESGKAREQLANAQKLKAYRDAFEALAKRIAASQRVLKDHERGSRIASMRAGKDIHSDAKIIVDDHAVSLHHPWEQWDPGKVCDDPEITAQAKALIEQAQALELIT